MDIQREIERRKQNWVDFYDLGSPVNRLLVVEYTQDAIPTPPLWWEKLPEREEWSYRRYMLQMENVERLHDNTVPYFTMITGTEIFAEAFGCPVSKPQGSNPFALPLIRDVSEFGRVKKPRLEDTKLPLLFGMAERLRKRAGGDALLSLPDILTPVDVAALIWEKGDFYASMFDEEPAIRELTGMVKELMFEFLNEWFRRFGPAFIAHYPSYYMPCGVTVSEDEVGIVSPQMYRDYFQEELHEFAERYGAIGIHCCAASDHQWENFKQVPNLKVLNFVRDTETLRRAAVFFGDTAAQFHNDPLDISDLPGSERIHLASFVYTDSLEKAIRIADEYNEKNGL